MSAPKFWLIAGPNGSGKSTLADTAWFAKLTATPESPEPPARLNADSEARAILRRDPRMSVDEASLKAAQGVDAQVDELIAGKRSLLVETVLSSDKYVERVERAKAAGFWIGLVYVFLRSPELNVRRVAQRVRMGGHDVPVGKIESRWTRSLERLPIFARLADVVFVIDNSSATAPAVLVLEATQAGLFVSPLLKTILAANDVPDALKSALTAVIADLERD